MYSTWSGAFRLTQSKDVITYVPMGVNSLRGTTTNLPKLFGWDYYTTEVDTTSISRVQVFIIPLPSMCWNARSIPRQPI